MMANTKAGAGLMVAGETGGGGVGEAGRRHTKTSR